MVLVLHDLSMHKPHFTQEQLAQVAKLSDNDLKRVNENRGMQSKLGYIGHRLRPPFGPKSFSIDMRINR